MKKKIAVLTGAGISAESGIPTFRGLDGLWEGHRVEDVATPEAWARDPELVQTFYNLRRKKALEVEPNPGHLTLAEMEKDFEVVIITQNVDNLHERAGSTNVIHLHGELFKSRSTVDETLVYDVEGWELKMGDCCEKGSQLRPHIVWFGEMVPMMEVAVREIHESDIVLVVGTSLQVYPAAGLVDIAGPDVPLYAVDPNPLPIYGKANLTFFQEPASTGVKKVYEHLRAS